jgi:hypothetical protein
VVRSVDMRGEVYGQLTVVEQGPSDANGKAQWFCLCTCGERKLVRALNLRQGRTRSCGLCSATHETGLDPDAMRYEVTVWSGPNSPSGKPFCFGEARDAKTGELVFRSTPPINREVSKGEIHAGATRCMSALAQLGLIGHENMRTGKRWAIEERVRVIVRPCATEDETFERWYDVTGIERPAYAPGHTEQGARPPVEMPPLTPDQEAGLLDLFQHWGID